MTSILYETHLCPDPDLPLLLHSCFIDSEVLPHWHTNIELLLIQTGQLLVTINDQEITAEPGDIIIIDSNCLHSMKTLTSHSTYRCLIIEHTFIAKFGLDYTHYHFKNKTTHVEISSLYKNMMKEFDTKSDFHKAILQGMSLQMIGLLHRYLAAEMVTNIKSGNTKIDIAKAGIDYIATHYHEPILIDNICNHVGVSKFHFCRVFKEVTNLTVNEFITHFRCTRAQLLLSQPNAVVSDCAIACGFNDASYFSKTYRKHFGYLPSEELKKDSY